VGVLGKHAAMKIGEAYDGGNGDIDYVTHKIAHAALGGTMAAATGGDIASGAIGGVVGEVFAEEFRSELEDAIRMGEVEPDQVQRWGDAGVDMSALVAGLAAAAAGGDVNTASETGANAAENNALCGGFCIAALAAAIWVLASGEGDPIEGLEEIGDGTDPLSQAIATGTKEAVNFSRKELPKETDAVIDVLGKAGENIDAIVTYVDEATGKEVSSRWNKLPERTRKRLKGGAKVVSVLIPGKVVTKLINNKAIKPIVKLGQKLKGKKYTPLDKGPLNTEIAKTFRSATYTEKITTKPTTLYRVISDNGNPAGGYWTRIKPKGPLQSVVDSALDQNWGNTATRVVKAVIPRGTTIYEGFAASQRGLVGGGNQVFIKSVNPKWITK